MSHDPPSPRCFVYSFKEGLLSKLAHDLKLEVPAIAVDTGPDGLPTALRFDVRSIDVVCRMQDGKEDTAGLPSGDRAKIRRTVREDVLAVSRHPEVVFRFEETAPAGDGFRVRGTLTLCGRSRPLEVVTRQEGGWQVADVTLRQPDFGITPYSAMLGALKVRADVRVRVEMQVNARGAPEVRPR